MKKYTLKVWIICLLVLATPSVGVSAQSSTQNDAGDEKRRVITPEEAKAIEHNGKLLEAMAARIVNWNASPDAPLPIVTKPNPKIPYSRWNPPRELVLQFMTEEEGNLVASVGLPRRVWLVKGGSRKTPLAVLDTTTSGKLKVGDGSLIVLGPGYLHRPLDPKAVMPRVDKKRAAIGTNYFRLEPGTDIKYNAEFEVTSEEKCDKELGRDCVLYRAKATFSLITGQAEKNATGVLFPYTPYAVYPVDEVYIEDPYAKGKDRHERLFGTRSSWEALLYGIAH